MKKLIDTLIIFCCANILTLAFIGWLDKLTIYSAIAVVTFNQLVLVSTLYNQRNKDIYRD